ncbi:DUF6318 family protein [Jonesia denitrificans]|uniref:DUF6318 domain-containing protein n=1 Tax=Jonesia denitrificans (strain ATCC 14870 / DSM 20603 / BCRC 15368 / CIP 55.134 / JCM 11481 / NBRC 15587 / NCTC 10816 / Prevot 55134) TaxID=471856 RepID=C7R2G4_JONDD|nr:DUF6318 family protein [Jonesia denitrificans]ACV08535.1 hypothetical protein Jden_0873 [Jonesia denitrificans DSM 20603]QXB42442.1 hypothetical protein I6L70_07660 [Jonesia denitrificans]SQH20518.1 Uncharacterised protein [Jonesia denitrificans]
MSVSLLRSYAVRRVFGVLVVAALLGAGVTGCSNDAGAKTENTVDASPTPTNTPTDGDGDSAEEPVENTPAEPEPRPTPVEPEAMKTSDKAGAIAAAQYFVEVIEHSMHTSTTDLLEKYSYEKCSMCNEYKRTIAKRKDNGILVTNSQYEIKDLGPASLWGKKQLIWEVMLNLSVKEEYENFDESYTTEHSLLFYVTYLPDGWVLTEVTPASKK